MASTVSKSFFGKIGPQKDKKEARVEKEKEKAREVIMSEFEDEFDFVGTYSEEVTEDTSELLPENTAESAIDCAFIGVGGGGGKLAKAFIDLGFSRTLLVNTTEKDQPEGIEPDNFLLIPGASLTYALF